MPKYLLWLTLGTFAIGTESFMIAGLLPSMSADLRVSISLAGQVVTVFAVTYAVSSPFLTVATGGISRKAVLLGAMVAFGLANLLAAISPDYAVLMVVRVLLGLSAGLFVPTASGYAAMSVAPNLRGRAISLVYFGQSLAIVFGVPLGTALGQHVSWRAAFLGVAGLAAIAFAGMAAGFPRMASPPVASLKERFKVAVRPDILSVLLLTVMAFTGGFTFYTYLAPAVADIAGYKGDALAVVLLLYGLGGVAGNFLGGYAGDKWSIRRSLLLALALLGADFALFSLSGQMPMAIAGPWAATTVFMAGLVGWTILPNQQLRLAALAGPLTPIAFSMNSSATFLGIALGAALGSVVIASLPVMAIGWVGGICELLGLLWFAAPLGQAVGKVRQAAE